MKPYALLLAVLLAPSLALADIDFTASGTHDCGSDPVINVTQGGGTYTFTGACTQVNLNGGDLTVTIESADELNVNGAKNKITVTTVGAIHVNGAQNKIGWKKAKTGKKPKVAVNGKSNAITKIK